MRVTVTTNLGEHIARRFAEIEAGDGKEVRICLILDVRGSKEEKRYLYRTD